jgi:hypothetical protein
MLDMQYEKRQIDCHTTTKRSQKAFGWCKMKGKDEHSDVSKISVANIEGSLESAARFTRGGTPAAPDHDATESGRSARIQAEQPRLIQWAKAHRKLGRKIPPEDSRGGEHRVFYSEKTGRYFKSTISEKHKGYGIALGSYSHGATPSEYLDRLTLQNKIFNDDIHLEWVTVKNGKPIIITSQPFISGPYPTQQEIDEMMIEHGFEMLVAGAYYDKQEGLLVFDLFPKNAKTNSAGVICPFDPVIQRITSEFAVFLREFPDRIHDR